MSQWWQIVFPTQDSKFQVLVVSGRVAATTGLPLIGAPWKIARKQLDAGFTCVMQNEK